MKSIIRAMLVIMFISCGDSDYYLKKYQEIWDCSNTNLQLAVDMFDTVHVYAEQQSEHLSHKYQLLQIRLDDKADIIPTSDAMILSLLKYFEDKGSRREKQEAYYYAGSVYRDLKDTPHSLTYFLRSVDIAQEGCCDSLLLRNAYSNLHWLYYSVQDFSMALEMALKEYDIACRINTVGTNVLTLIPQHFDLTLFISS